MAQADAFLIHQGTLFQPSVPFLLEGFVSPVCALVEGIWLQTPEFARAILRERIFTNYALSPACEGIIKLSAKRATRLNETEYQLRKSEPASRLKIQICTPRIASHFIKGDLIGTQLNENQISTLLKSLKDQVSLEPKKFNSARPVSAVLVDPDQRVLAYAYNCNASIKIQHAEHELVRAFVLKNQRKIPSGSSLWVSLKPCCMCAGNIMSASENVELLAIHYLEDDPGPKAANSCFNVGSDLWIKSGSPKISMKIVK